MTYATPRKIAKELALSLNHKEQVTVNVNPDDYLNFKSGILYAQKVLKQRNRNFWVGHQVLNKYNRKPNQKMKVQISRID